MRKFLNLLFSLLVIFGILLLMRPKPVYGDGVKFYTIRWGDTLSSISRRLGIPMATLVKLNKIGNPNLIFAGQKLRLSGSEIIKPVSYLPTGSLWIEVDLSQQRLNFYQGREIIFSTLVSTGIARYPTPTGTFRIWGKYRFDDMKGGSRKGGDYYFLPKVPHVLYYYKSYALHGTYWHNNFGRPMSHGCINLSQADALYLYNHVGIGTPVVVHI